MTTHHLKTWARLLMLLAAMPWHALQVQARATFDSPGDAAPVSISFSEQAAVVTALSTARKSVFRGDYAGVDGTALPVVTHGVILTASVVCLTTLGTLRITSASLRCAFLCKFLI